MEGFEMSSVLPPSMVRWLWQKRFWFLTVAIILLAIVLIGLGAPLVQTIFGLILAILINILTSYRPSKIKDYSKIFEKHSQSGIERLKAKALKPQNFYVCRKKIEDDVKSWIEESKKGFAVIFGVAGGGKTNLLFNLATEFLTKNYAVLFIESDLLDQFKKEKLEDKPFSDVLTSIKNEEGKKTLLLLDTLDLIAYNRGMRKLIEFLGDVRQCDEAIILGSIRLPEYENLKDKVIIDKPFLLAPLSKDEVEELFQRYNRRTELIQDILDLLSIPLHAHMFIEVYEKEEIPAIVNFVQLYEKYWWKKVESLRDGALPGYPQKDRDTVKKSKVKLAYSLASMMFQNRTLRRNKTDFLRDIGDLEYGDQAYNDLISERILVEYKHSGNYLEFFHRTFCEYAVARYLIENQTDDQLKILIEGTNLEIPFYSAIFEYIALLAKTRDKVEVYKAILDKLYESPSHFQHILLIDLLNNLPKLEEHEIKILKDLNSKDIDSIDYMLGLLISRIWRPKESIFTVLEELARSGECEIKRRVAEALPNLIVRDRGHSLKLIEILRADYDERWKTDNRRRVIEAIPYLIENGYLEVDDFLRIREDDQFYVIIAIIETLDCLKCVSPAKANILIESLKDQLSDEQTAFVFRFLDLLEKTRLNKDAALEMMKAIMYHKVVTFILPTGDDVYRLCVARILPRLLKSFPNDILEMMNALLKPIEHRNVRRPLVRHVRELIEFMVKEKVYKDKVEEIVWALATDKDEIIPIMFLDNVSYLTKIAPDISNKIANYYLSNEGEQTLRYFSDKGKGLIKRRVEEVKKELERKNLA
jgi:GTPase SAR1 family protein